ncbi:hypothetical protein ACF0H5_012459 [Mactra antiquata]
MNKFSGFVMVFQVLYSNCLNITLTPVDPEVTEGNNVTFVCTVSGTVEYVTWSVNNATHPKQPSTVSMAHRASCTLSPPTAFLSNKNKYSYDCNSTVYQVTEKNIQRSEHSDTWSCILHGESSGPYSTIKVQGPVQYVTLTPEENTANVEENTTIVFTCITSGARPKASVTWYTEKSGETQINENCTSNTTDDDFSVTTSTLRFVPFRKQQGVKIYCNAENQHNKVAEKSEHEVEVNVLFPPVVGELRNFTMEKGSELNISCPYTPGNPNKTTVKWSINKYRNGERLIIPSIDEEDAGLYTCTASNTMKTWNGSTYNGEDKKSFYLRVLYKAVVTSFTIKENESRPVIVDENATVSFKCVTDGEPIPNVRLKNSHSDLKTDTTQTLDYVIDEAKCLDADNYTCSASNQHNVNESVQSLQLYVRCRPRSADRVIKTKTSEIDASVTFIFNAIAYPKPTFTWKKWDMNRSQWKNLSNGGDIVIKSSDLQSNLTIQNVTQKYFTRYELEITNAVGNMKQMYTLSPYDKPKTPAGFHYVEDLTTTTSIHLQWKPGFNGGPQQTFHIKYKKSTTNTWHYINISDTGEDIMRYTLTGLAPKTQYHIIIYASNIKGKSESIVRVVQTKERTVSLGPLIGGIVGGTAVLGILIIVGIIIWRRYPTNKEKQKNKTLTQRQATVSRSSESESDGDEMVENQLYERSDPMYAIPIKSKVQQGAKGADHKPNSKEMGGGDIYAEVDKKKKKQPKKKGQKGKVNKNVEDTCENANINTNEEQKSKIVNKYGLNYADLVFNNKTPGEKTKVSNESVPYDAVDFTKKAEPLPDDDDKKA